MPWFWMRKLQETLQAFFKLLLVFLPKDLFSKVCQLNKLSPHPCLTPCNHQLHLLITPPPTLGTTPHMAYHTQPSRMGAQVGFFLVNCGQDWLVGRNLIVGLAGRYHAVFAVYKRAASDQVLL
jgi:hypothetical protein